jgi:hypothetical protein
MLNTHLVDIIKEELDAYCRDGHPVHLAHVARVIQEALASDALGAAREPTDVAAAEKGR